MSEELSLDPPWKQAVVDILSKFSPDEIISHEWMDAALCLEIPDTGSRETFRKLDLKRLAAIDALKEDLLTKHSLMLYSSRGDGYVIVPAQKQTDVTLNTLKKDLRKVLGNASDRLCHIDRTKLSADELKSNADAICAVASIASFSRNTNRQLKRAQLKLSGDNNV